MSLSVGEKLGPYEIIALIGAGGMGEVYKARDPRLRRDVAIKVSAQQFSERFEREAHAIAALNHPNICQVYDIGPNYLVMEFIEGTPLKGPLPLNQALKYAVQICDALDAAHEKGITHRDLKPGNILATASGVKLLDFGLAKVAATKSPDGATQTMPFTEAGAVMGTAAYMSPEQAKGEEVDARSDVFSFGVVLYEMLSGRRAFARNSSIETMSAILRDEPAALDAPSHVSEIVMRCLRKSSKDRFQTVSDVRRALDQARAKPAQSQPSIAVLPFANMTSSPDDEYFSDGLAEEIINALTQVRNLKVIARTSAFAFKGKNEDIRKIAETLGVTNVLEGSVRRVGPRIRVTAQLIHAADGTHLWSQRYDRELTDVFAVQDEIAEAIAGQLKVNLTGAKRSVTNIPAYEAYLEGHHHTRKYSLASVARGLECFERALSFDPEYAMAHVGLARYYATVAAIGIGDPREVLPRAEAASRRALELEETNADVHAVAAVLRVMRDYDWAGAARHFHRALELNPTSPDIGAPYAYWYLRILGRLGEAVQVLDSVLTQDPLAASPRVLRAGTLFSLRRHPESEQECRRILSIDSGYVFAQYYLALSLGFQQRFEEALETARRLIEVSGKWSTPLAGLGMVCALAGRVEEAHDAIGELKDVARKSHVPPGYIALIHAMCGENDAAFEWAGKAVEQRDPMILAAKVDPRFDRIRDDPRFESLLQRMNLA